MPNWCWNKLYVKGHKHAITKLRESIRTQESELSFETFLPTPPEEDIHDEELNEFAQSLTAMPPWYRWRVSNWGTKWDAFDPTMTSMTEESITYEFSTAWAPPYEAIETLSKFYPSLIFTLEYDEPGNDFWGICELQNGSVLTSSEGPSKMFGVEEDLPDDEI